MTLVNSISYNKDRVIFFRFVDHVKLACTKNIMEHKKNILEKLGDCGLYMVEEFPKKIFKIMKDPRVVTVALTAFALLATSLIFYPVTTFLTVKAALLLLPQIPLWAVRFTAYVSVVGLIISTALRAMGRFINKELMNKFYNNELAAKIQIQVLNAEGKDKTELLIDESKREQAVEIEMENFRTPYQVEITSIEVPTDVVEDILTDTTVSAADNVVVTVVNDANNDVNAD